MQKGIFLLNDANDENDGMMRMMNTTDYSLL